MGSLSVFGYLGGKLDVFYDSLLVFWGNCMIVCRMLECGLNQGNVDVVFNFGGVSVGDKVEFDQDNDCVWIIFQEGIRFGSYMLVNYLFGSFDDGDVLFGIGIDKFCVDCYWIFFDVFQCNFDLCFFNFDKVFFFFLVKLFMWNGDCNILFDVVKLILQRFFGFVLVILNLVWLCIGCVYIL